LLDQRTGLERMVRLMRDAQGSRAPIQKLVDRVTGYLAPALLGAGPAALGDAAVTTMAAARRLELTDVTRVGPDLRITAVPRATAAHPVTEEP
jgi:cation transport ATPase